MAISAAVIKGREGDAANPCTVAIGFGHPRARDGAGKALAGSPLKFICSTCLSFDCCNAAGVLMSQII